jgi:hypothetical protein
MMKPMVKKIKSERRPEEARIPIDGKQHPIETNGSESMRRTPVLD